MALNNAPESSLPDALMEQAAIWHARLREPDGSAREQDFQNWLARDPRHAQAYREAERLWRALAAPAVHVADDEAHRSAAIHASIRYGAMAASLIILLGAGLLWRTGMIDTLRSDHVTATGQRAPVELADGSTITLNSDSALKIDLQTDRRGAHLFRGEAWFDVAKDATRPFTVETPNGSVRVTGTSFDVRVDETTTIVSLASGRVELVSASMTAPTVLEPGQQARVTANGISNPVRFDPTTVSAWRRGQIVFYDTALDAVVDDLNRYRTGRIVITNDALNRLKVSGVFRTDDPDAALNAIASTLPVRVTRITDYLVLLR